MALIRSGIGKSHVLNFRLHKYLDFYPRREGDKPDWKVFCGVEPLFLALTWFHPPHRSKHTTLCFGTRGAVSLQCCGAAAPSAEPRAWYSVWSGDTRGPGAHWQTSWELGQSLAGNMSGMCHHEEAARNFQNQTKRWLTVSAILRFISVV